MSSRRSSLKNVKRIVIKVGTSTLTYETGKLNLSRIEGLVRVISDIRNSGVEVILVTSGAIGVGLGRLNFTRRPDNLRDKQAAAAVGQCELMHIYNKLFSEYGYAVGQILLTRDVVEKQERRENVENTFKHLFKYNVIPIVNENDSVAVDEILFGDNDTLSAIVAAIVKAELLILLSDVDGLFDGNPREERNAKLISEVSEITDEIEKAAGGAGTTNGTGGMVTKLAAAKIVNSAGIHMALVNGANPEVIHDILQGKELGTIFWGKACK